MASSKITTFMWPAMAAFGAMLSSIQPAAADRSTGYCVYSYGLEICDERWAKAVSGLPRIIQVPAPRTEDTEERDQHARKWRARCRPVIEQDQYGVGRYYYAAPGCEFGKTED
jgi:hypothetical protein